MREGMYCPTCGRALRGPRGGIVPYPMYVCTTDGVVYDQRRQSWYGLAEAGEHLACPACGHAMETEPSEGAPRLYFCYQCGVTFDKARNSWFGHTFHDTEAH